MTSPTIDTLSDDIYCIYFNLEIDKRLKSQTLFVSLTQEEQKPLSNPNQTHETRCFRQGVVHPITPTVHHAMRKILKIYFFLKKGIDRISCW